MKEAKKDDNLTISKLIKIQTELKNRNNSLWNELKDKTISINKMTSEINSLTEPKLPMTVSKQEIYLSEHNDYFENHIDFIEQTIVKVLSSSNRIQNDADIKISDAVRLQMNNSKINLIILEH